MKKTTHERVVYELTPAEVEDAIHQFCGCPQGAVVTIDAGCDTVRGATVTCAFAVEQE